MDKWDRLADKETIEKTIKALEENGMHAVFVKNKEEATKKILELIPEKSEVFTMTSMTLEALGILPALNESVKYHSVRKQLSSMDRAKHKGEIRKLGAAPAYAIGSVHAVTQDGKVIIASNTGSQLPAYAYGAGKVIWVVGAQKLVKNLDEGMKRLYEHTLPLESERARKAYGVPGSFISKMLIVNKEVQKDRITLIIINKVLGF